MNKVLLAIFFFFFFSFASTGQVVDTRIPSVNGQVSSIFQSGDTVYIGGSFTTVGGLPRNYLAAFNATTGEVLSWAPNPNAPAGVAGTLNDNLLVGGDFDTIAGQPRNSWAQFDAEGGLTSWSLNPALTKYAIWEGEGIVYNNIWYLVTFDTVAAIDLQSQTLLWANPNTTYSSYNFYSPAIEVSGDTIYFTSEKDLFAIDCKTGKTIFWHDTIDQQAIYDIAAANGNVYIAGTFGAVNGVPRTGVAQLDMHGNVTGWNAYSTSDCLSLSIQGNYIYVGGFFSSIGQNFIYNNYRLGKLDIATADQVCWDIDQITTTESTINVIYTYDTMVYISGSLTGNNAYLFSAANSPCANLCLTIEGNTGCTGANGTITVYGSETGVTYQAYAGTTAVGVAVAGNGSIITLTIPAVSLDSGSNIFNIQAAKQGCTAFLKNTATINVTNGTIPAANIFYTTYPENGAPQIICPSPDTFPGPLNYFGLYGNFDPNTNYTVLATPGYKSSEPITPRPFFLGGYLLDVNYSILAPGVNILTILASNACGHVYLNEIDTVTYLSPAYINSSTLDPTSICQGTKGAVTILNSKKNLQYDFVMTIGNTYEYGAGSGTGNGGNLNISIDAIGLPPGNLSVEVFAVDPPYNSCPNLPLSNLGPVTILPAPAPPVISIIGDTILCKSGQITTAVGPSGYSSYQWFYNAGNSVISGATNASYEIINNGSLSYELNYPEEIYFALSVTDSYGCSSLNDRPIYFGNIGDTIISYASSFFCGKDSTLLWIGKRDDMQPITYQWMLNNNAIIAATDSLYYANQTGNYSVTIKSPQGYCTYNLTEVPITAYPLPIINAGINDTVCIGQQVGLGGNPTVTGGTLPYNYLWSSSLGFSSAAANPVLIVDTTALFTLSVTDSAGCGATDSVTITTTNDTVPTINLVNDTALCFGDKVSLTATGSGSFLWSSGDTTSTIIVAADTTSSYTITLTNQAGCSSSAKVKVTVNALPVPLASSIQTGFIDSSIVLQSLFPTGQTFSWSPALGLNDSTLASPTFTPLQNGTYSFAVKATDNNGCSNTDTVTVDVTGITATVKASSSNPVKVYPNPYSGFTNITYQLNEQSSVTAEVFNVIGERLSQFVNEVQQPGAYHYQFSGAASGMYIVKITINNNEYYQKVVQQ